MDVLDRMGQRLLEALKRENVPVPGNTLTIAEIYQRFIPYRSVRSELGFGELAEYEHTLLRLLAGEQGYVQVELPQVQDEFRRELRSTTPILGLYRDYAAVGVRVNPQAAAAVPTASPAPFPQESAVPTGERETVPAQRESTTPRAAAPPPAAPAEDLAPPPPASAPGRRVGCRSCRQPLPLSGGMDVRFCPFCGESQQAVPCRECGTSLEPGWSFCVYCGTSRRILPPSRA